MSPVRERLLCTYASGSRSAFLVFDLVGRNASLQSEGNARGLIHPEFDDGIGSK